MTKKEHQLSDKQFQINLLSNCQTIATNTWLAAQGFKSGSFNTTHIQLLQAQQAATQIIKHHHHLLTTSQRTTLENFLQQMAHKNTRSRLKPQAAHPILNISSKLNRQLFKQHRSLTQA
jgi:poly-D-alanine transfer protein DltD